MSDPTLSPAVALNAVASVVMLQQAIDADHRRLVALLNAQLEVSNALIARKEKEHAEQLEKGRAENAALFKDREKLTRDLADVDQKVRMFLERLLLAIKTSEGPQPHDAPDLRERVRKIVDDLQAGRVLEPT